MKLFNGKKIVGKPNLTKSYKRGQDDLQIMFDNLDKVLKHDFVKQVSWTQYTPYFNDGDICEFRINKPEVEFTFPITTQLEKEYTPGPKFSNWDFEYYKTKLPEFAVLTKEFLEDFRNFTTSLVTETNENIIYETFGDHAEVIATKKKITIEDYTHD